MQKLQKGAAGSFDVYTRVRVFSEVFDSRTSSIAAMYKTQMRNLQDNRHTAQKLE